MNSRPISDKLGSMTISSHRNKFIPTTSMVSIADKLMMEKRDELVMEKQDELEIEETDKIDLDFVSLARDQYGCRFLQKKLESNGKNQLFKDQLFEELKPILLDLIMDPFGNYLIQKLIVYLDSNQIIDLLNLIHSNFGAISSNQFGTRSLQKVIDSVDIDDPVQTELLLMGFKEYLSNDQLINLINDLNGNHVIQKLIFKFKDSILNLDFLIDSICLGTNIIKISTHKHGCCVLQKLLNLIQLSQFEKISIRILSNLIDLINNQFGNYIIQFILSKKFNCLEFQVIHEKILIEFYQNLSFQFYQLSCLKFSSNVIENYIKILFTSWTSSQDNIIQLSNIIIKIIDCFTINLNSLIKDNYGNYTLQTLLDIKQYSSLLATSNNKYNVPNDFPFLNLFNYKINHLMLLTKELLPSIKATTYLKKIKSKIKNYTEFIGIPFNEFTQDLSNSITTSTLSTPFSTKRQRTFSSNSSLIPSNITSIDSTPIKNSDEINETNSKHTRYFSLPSNNYFTKNKLNNVPMINTNNHTRSLSTTVARNTNDYYPTLQTPNSSQSQISNETPISSQTPLSSIQSTDSKQLQLPFQYQPQSQTKSQAYVEQSQNQNQILTPNQQLSTEIVSPLTFNQYQFYSNNNNLHLNTSMDNSSNLTTTSLSSTPSTINTSSSLSNFNNLIQTPISILNLQNFPNLQNNYLANSNNYSNQFFLNNGSNSKQNQTIQNTLTLLDPNDSEFTLPKRFRNNSLENNFPISTNSLHNILSIPSNPFEDNLSISSNVLYSSYLPKKIKT
ncbi:hypothetical protein TBLA_0F00380 [Henningerozyma blattae CBS 6284]|uniref:PUM-HD domain-containing protein n=1 Tax=Henningerozyma blattae (strain ATCC 34711 / CBS 6284 / DSM 70876 / NBRC 10599 / NRRL Y-10934 / UCD 77-7) TaxID=1071380 RepID=I2H5D0_HENB6|nr:hypothetical protein TBLA_0F00380 [Tetrapisispora blattae CBS 6284]CCH61582.1 hypothetical protein TBLA_0F00380 [Tetrapisispora blattae CBS 6284]